MTIALTLVTQETRGMLTHIAPEVFDSPIDPSWLGGMLADPSQSLWIACDGDLVVGQLKAVLHHHPDKPPTFYVDEVGVSPSHQRRGIAKSLFQSAKEHAANLGCHEIWLATEPDNDPANALYKAVDLRGEHVVVYSLSLQSVSSKT